MYSTLLVQGAHPHTILALYHTCQATAPVSAIADFDFLQTINLTTLKPMISWSQHLSAMNRVHGERKQGHYTDILTHPSTL
jgi:hypothetical protein